MYPDNLFRMDGRLSRQVGMQIMLPWPCRLLDASPVPGARARKKKWVAWYAIICFVCSMKRCLALHGETGRLFAGYARW